MRTIIAQQPFLEFTDKTKAPWQGRGNWPARWIACPGCEARPFVAAFRKRFTLDRDAAIRAHASADERYELFLDGRRIGRGSERGDAGNWFFETYDLKVPKGDHVLVARVWALGDKAPYAQMTVRPGFIFAPEGEFLGRLGTGVAPWEAKRLGGYDFSPCGGAFGTGWKCVIDGTEFSWGFETGEGDGWQPATAIHAGANAGQVNEVPPVHRMTPATLPAMLEVERQVGAVRFVAEVASAETEAVAVLAKDHVADEAGRWAAILRGGTLMVPPDTRRRVIIDLEDYYCAYPQVVTSGGRGSTLRLLWAEALYLDPKRFEKGNRNEIEGKFFRGIGDAFRPDGGRHRRFDTLWWEAGRYLELYVETAGEPLVIERLALRETRYPLEMESRFEAGGAPLARVIPIALRGLQMCSHETYMDCPYYEQLMYIGDTRLEVLATYCATRDDRLPRKAVRMFDASRLLSGLTQSRYPSRVTQVIPPFSLWHVAMVHDFARWRDDPAFVRQAMPGVRGVIDAFLSYRNADGLIEAPPGWNYVDWVPAWTWGIPPDADHGVNGIINWQMVLALGLAAELEAYLGEKELAARADRLARDLAARTAAAFWDKRRGLFADDRKKRHFSEHAQCLAILGGRVPAKYRARVVKGLFAAEDLERTTLYFTHYLFETCRVLGRMDVLFDRLGLWLGLEGQGFKTPLESPEPSRSDCHAWAAHPIYHYFATILGIRPGDFGFRTVRIMPQLGPLSEARGELVHPKGMIEVDLKADGKRLRGRMVLPKGVTGAFTCGARSLRLRAGINRI